MYFSAVSSSSLLANFFVIVSRVLSVLRAKKAMVDDEFEEIIRNRHAEIEAAFVSTQSEL